MASQVPTMYDGTTSQVVFAEYFRLQAVYQDWDNDKACLVLHLFLRGNAKKVFAAFNPKDNIENCLKEIIDKCAQPQEFLLHEFFQRKQHVGESISTFAAALEALLQAADPSMPEINQTKLLKAQLSNSLPDHTRELINFNPAMTWADLLRNLDRSIPRVAATEAKLPLIKAEPFEVNWLSTHASHNNRPSYPRSNPNTDSNGDQGNRFNGTCHFCHKFGHREFECRTKARDNAEQYTNDCHSISNDNRRDTYNYRGSSYNVRSPSSSNQFSNNNNNASRRTQFSGNNRFSNSQRADTNNNTGGNVRGIHATQNHAGANFIDSQIDEFPYFADTTAVELSSKSPGTSLLKALVHVKIFDQLQTRVVALIDGGSSHSFISPSVLTSVQMKLAADSTNGLGMRRNFVITSATTETKSACCVTTAEVQIGSWVGTHPFVISGAVNKHEMIIGRDFFVKHKVIIDHAEGLMIIDGTSINLNTVEVVPCIYETKQQEAIVAKENLGADQMTSILEKIHDLLIEQKNLKQCEKETISPVAGIVQKSERIDLLKLEPIL